MNSSYKINPDLQKEVLASVLGGVYFMLSSKIEDFMSIVGYILILWYIFWIAILFDLIVHPWHYQPDIYLVYLLIDVSTFSYFFFNVYVLKLYKARVWNLLANFLIVWYLAYSLVDIFIPSTYAPNNSSIFFNICMVGLSTFTAGMIVYGEVEKNHLEL